MYGVFGGNMCVGLLRGSSIEAGYFYREDFLDLPVTLCALKIDGQLKKSVLASFEWPLFF